MNKAQLIEVLAAHFEGNKRQAAQALDAVVDTITREVARGEKVAISGFGAFEKAVRPARMVHNPQTGELIEAAARSVLRFRPSAQLRDVISGARQLPARTLGVALAAGGVIAGRGRTGSTSGGGAGSTDSQPAATREDLPSAPAATTTTAKQTTSGTAAKKSAAKKSAAKRTTSTRRTTSDTAAKKSAAKQTTSPGTAKKTTGQSAAKKATAKKATAKKSTANKTTANKTTANKTTAKKATAKKTTRGRSDTDGTSKTSSESDA